MLDILQKQMELIPGDPDLAFLIHKTTERPGRIVEVMFIQDEDINSFIFRVEVRDSENDLVGLRFFYNPAKVPYIFAEMIRLGHARAFFERIKKETEEQLEELRRALLNGDNSYHQD